MDGFDAFEYVITIVLIQERLSHGNILTTRNYDFPDEVKKEAALDLVNIVKSAVLHQEPAPILQVETAGLA